MMVNLRGLNETVSSLLRELLVYKPARKEDGHKNHSTTEPALIHHLPCSSYSEEEKVTRAIANFYSELGFLNGGKQQKAETSNHSKIEIQDTRFGYENAAAK